MNYHNFSSSAKDTADQIRPLLPLAKRAYGSQPAGSPARVASDQVNQHILRFVQKGGSIPVLAAALSGDISLSGLRRRIRVARATEQALLEGYEAPMETVKRPRGSKDPEMVREAVEAIDKARSKGGREYGDAVRTWYDKGVSMQAVADEMGISTYSLWSARKTSY